MVALDDEIEESDDEGSEEPSEKDLEEIEDGVIVPAYDEPGYDEYDK